MRRLLLVPLAGLGFAAAVAVGSTAASNGEAKRTVSASGVIKVIRPGSITVHSAFDVTCRRTDASPDVSRFSPGDLVKIRCSGSVLRRIAPARSPLARPSPPTNSGSDEHGATTTATAAGSITSLGSGSITVNVEHPLTCTVGAGSPALGDYHVGDVVRIGCAGGALSVIVRKESSPSPTTTRPSETIEAAAGTNAYGNGAISSLATSSVTVTGDGSITCRVADGSPSLAGYRVGDRVKIACRGGALSAIVRSDGTDEHPATTTTTTTTTGGTVAYANGTITSIGAGAITVTGDRSTTCTIGAGSPGLGDFHQGDAVRIYCANGVLTAIVRQTAPTTTIQPTTTTQSSASSSTGSITAIAAGSITVTGDRSTTCAIGVGPPGLGDYRLGEHVRIYCTNGVLSAVTRP